MVASGEEFPASNAQHPEYKQCDAPVAEAVGSWLEQSFHAAWLLFLQT